MQGLLLIIGWNFEDHHRRGGRVEKQQQKKNYDAKDRSSGYAT